MSDYTALYSDDASLEEQVACYQALINSGDAWRFEGAVGRAAMSLINEGYCMVGTTPRRDYWGNLVPSRDMLKPGTKGTRGYVEARHPEVFDIIDNVE